MPAVKHSTKAKTKLTFNDSQQDKSFDDLQVTKESQIRNLKEEMTHQDELVEKLQVRRRKEKTMIMTGMIETIIIMMGMTRMFISILQKGWLPWLGLWEGGRRGSGKAENSIKLMRN